MKYIYKASGIQYVIKKKNPKNQKRVNKSTKNFYQAILCYNIVSLKIMILNNAITFYIGILHVLHYLILRAGL